jgi:predicted nucleotidyltransferase
MFPLDVQQEASRPIELKLVIRFGSTAAGRQRPDSDVDLAVLAERELTLADQERVVIELARRQGIGEDRIDLVDLQTAPPLLQHEIAEHGELLEGDPDDFLRFRLTAWKAYQDTAKLRRAREQNLRRRLDVP